MKLERYKKKLISKRTRIILSIFLFMSLITGIGYASLMSELSINGNIDVSALPIIGPYGSSLQSTYLSDDYREKILTVNLETTIDIPANADIVWDVGTTQNRVKAFLIRRNGEEELYDLYIQCINSLEIVT